MLLRNVITFDSVTTRMDDNGSSDSKSNSTYRQELGD